MLKRTAFAIILAATVFVTNIVGASAAGEVTRLRYDERGGDGPTLVIKGSGCLQAEDSATLVLVNYIGGGAVGGSDDTLVYRCKTS
jgi:hypothetical protein